MAKVTRRTSVPSNGRISFLPRIYEFYIGAWFCVEKEGGSPPRQPPPQHGMQEYLAPDWYSVLVAVDGAKVTPRKDTVEKEKKSQTATLGLK